MVKVEMDGYILPIVNELTGAVSQDFLVPIGREFKENPSWSIQDDGSLDEIVLEIKNHGPLLSDCDRHRHEIRQQKEFSTIYTKELTQSRSRYLLAMSRFADAVGVSSVIAGTGAIAIEYFPSLVTMGSEMISFMTEVGARDTSVEYFPSLATMGSEMLSFMTGAGAIALEYFPSLVTIGSGVLTLGLTGLLALLTIGGVKSLVDARTKRHAGTIADHFSTNLNITQSDGELSSRVMELHAYFETLEGPSKQLNLDMASKADELDLPVVKTFYEKRVGKKKGSALYKDGMMYKLFSKGMLRSMKEDVISWFIGNDLNTVKQIGKGIGKVEQQSKVDLRLPVTLLPSFNGCDVFVGYHKREDLSDFATRAGECLDAKITFDVFSAGHISQGQQEHLENNIADAIHDNVYRKARIFNVLPKKLVETGSKAEKYVCIAGGIGMGAVSALTLFLGPPVAAAAFGIGGAYLIARPFLTKPLRNADKFHYERLIKGYDTLQDTFETTDSFSYHVDSVLSTIQGIIDEHDTPYAAYTACVNAAKLFDRPRIAGHYIHKALSVQPMDRELRPGIMELVETQE